MKVYKVFTKKDSQEYLKNGYVMLQHQKEMYELFGSINELLGMKKGLVNTFSSEEINGSMFFFASLVDAVRYVRCFKYAFGNYDKNLDYLILEMDMDICDMVRYLGVGFYNVSRKFENYLALEMAIPLDKIKEIMKFSLVCNGLWEIINGYIYTNNSDEVIEISKYLEYGDMKVDMMYQEGLLKLLKLLGFKCDWYGLVREENEHSNSKSFVWPQDRKWEMFMYNLLAMEQRNGKILQRN